MLLKEVSYQGHTYLIKNTVKNIVKYHFFKVFYLNIF